MFGWSPRGHMADSGLDRYDISSGKWLGSNEPADPNGVQFTAPPGTASQKIGWNLMYSPGASPANPLGVQAPKQFVNLDRTSGVLYPEGQQAPRHTDTLTMIPDGQVGAGQDDDAAWYGRSGAVGKGQSSGTAGTANQPIQVRDEAQDILDRANSGSPATTQTTPPALTPRPTATPIDSGDTGSGLSAFLHMDPSDTISIGRVVNGQPTFVVTHTDEKGEKNSIAVGKEGADAYNAAPQGQRFQAALAHGLGDLSVLPKVGAGTLDYDQRPGDKMPVNFRIKMPNGTQMPLTAEEGKRMFQTGLYPDRYPGADKLNAPLLAEMAGKKDGGGGSADTVTPKTPPLVTDQSGNVNVDAPQNKSDVERYAAEVARLTNAPELGKLALAQARKEGTAGGQFPMGPKGPYSATYNYAAWGGVSDGSAHQAYATPEAGAKGYVDFLMSNPRYAKVIEGAKNGATADQLANEIANAGWAGGDPNLPPETNHRNYANGIIQNLGAPAPEGGFPRTGGGASAGGGTTPGSSKGPDTGDNGNWWTGGIKGTWTIGQANGQDVLINSLTGETMPLGTSYHGPVTIGKQLVGPNGDVRFTGTDMSTSGRSVVRQTGDKYAVDPYALPDTQKSGRFLLQSAAGSPDYHVGWEDPSPFKLGDDLFLPQGTTVAQGQPYTPPTVRHGFTGQGQDDEEDQDRLRNPFASSGKTPEEIEAISQRLWGHLKANPTGTPQFGEQFRDYRPRDDEGWGFPVTGTSSGGGWEQRFPLDGAISGLEADAEGRYRDQPLDDRLPFPHMDQPSRNFEQSPAPQGRTGTPDQGPLGGSLRVNPKIGWGGGVISTPDLGPQGGRAIGDTFGGGSSGRTSSADTNDAWLRMRDQRMPEIDPRVGQLLDTSAGGSAANKPGPFELPPDFQRAPSNNAEEAQMPDPAHSLAQAQTHLQMVQHMYDQAQQGQTGHPGLDTMEYLGRLRTRMGDLTQEIEGLKQQVQTDPGAGSPPNAAQQSDDPWIQNAMQNRDSLSDIQRENLERRMGPKMGDIGKEIGSFHPRIGEYGRDNPVYRRPVGGGEEEPGMPMGGSQSQSIGWRPPIDPSQVKGIGNRFGEQASLGPHMGTDIQAIQGTPVSSEVDGQVLAVQDQPVLGLTVIIRDAQGNEHKYGHLLSASVKPGDPVKAGDLIAQVGSSGSGSTGPHLHVAEKDQMGNPVNIEPKMGAMAQMGMSPDTVGGGQEERHIGWGQDDRVGVGDDIGGVSGTSYGGPPPSPSSYGPQPSAASVTPQAQPASSAYTNPLTNQQQQQLNFQYQQENDRHDEAMRQATSYAAQQAETQRHNQVMERLQEQQQALQLMEQGTFAQRAAQDQTMQGTFAQNQFQKQLQSALGNPWVQSLSGLRPGWGLKGGANNALDSQMFEAPSLPTAKVPNPAEAQGIISGATSNTGMGEDDDDNILDAVGYGADLSINDPFGQNIPSVAVNGWNLPNTLGPQLGNLGVDDPFSTLSPTSMGNVIPIQTLESYLGIPVGTTPRTQDGMAQLAARFQQMTGQSISGNLNMSGQQGPTFSMASTSANAPGDTDESKQNWTIQGQPGANPITTTDLRKLAKDYGYQDWQTMDPTELAAMYSSRQGYPLTPSQNNYSPSSAGLYNLNKNTFTNENPFQRATRLTQLMLPTASNPQGMTAGQATTLMGKVLGQQGMTQAPNVTQMDYAGSDPLKKIGWSQIADVTGQGNTAWMNQQQRQWAPAQSSSVGGVIGSSGGSSQSFGGIS